MLTLSAFTVTILTYKGSETVCHHHLTSSRNFPQNFRRQEGQLHSPGILLYNGESSQRLIRESIAPEFIGRQKQLHFTGAAAFRWFSSRRHHQGLEDWPSLLHCITDYFHYPPSRPLYVVVSPQILVLQTLLPFISTSSPRHILVPSFRSHPLS